MSRPGLTPSSYTPVFGVPSLSGITTPRAPAAGLSRGGIGSIGGDATGAPSLESAMKYINELSAQLRPETAGTEPYIAFSPSRKELFVNGFTFAENDAARALESEQYLGQSPVRPEAGDWQQLPTNIYSEYLQSIKDPTAGERFAKSFSSGVGSLQQLWGAALMLATDGGMGEELYQAGTARMERLAPYAKKFSEIKNLDDAGDFMVGLLGSQTPQILESITTALIGAGVGAAIGSTGTPAGTALGGAGGAILGLTAKGAVKKQLTDIARKKFLKQAVTPAEEALWKQQSGPMGAALQLVAKKKAAGEVLTPDEQKLLRQGAAVTGALTLSTLESYGIGAGDIYSEMMEKGVADQPGARATAALYAAPYAALGAAPEFLAALAFLRPSARTGVRAAAGRFGTGTAVGAGAEGVSEASQEALIMQAAGGLGAQYTPQERTERLLESFAAGAALGGALGGPVNLLRRPERAAGITPPAEPAPTEPTEPPAPTEPAQLGYEQPLMLGYEPTEARRAAEGEVIVPPAPPPRPPRPPEGPTLADIGDVPEPPAPESILGTRAGLPPSWQRANAPEIPLEAQFQGGVPQQEEFVSAPPVVPGQEETFFQDEDLGRGRTRPTAEEEAAAEAEAKAAAEAAGVSPIGGTTLRQAGLFTSTGEPTVTAAIGASFGTEKPLNDPQKTALRKLLSIGKPITKNGAPLFGQAEATKLISADGVVLQPNDFNIRGLVNNSTGSVIEVSFPDTKVKVAYDENRWGSPQQFAKAIGFDFGLLDTGTFVRRNKDGSVSAAQPIVDYVAPPPPIDMTARTERRAKSSLKKGAAAAGTAAKAKPKKTIKKKGEPSAVQKRKPAPVDVRQQAAAGEGVRDEDRAKRKPAGKGKAKETKETKPVRETVTVVDFPETKKDEDGRFTVTLSDGSTVKVYFDRSAPLGSGWYLDERSKFAPSQPEYVSNYLGANRKEAIDNLPETLARLRASQPQTQAVSRGKMPLDERKRTLANATNEALIEETTTMKTPALKSPQGEYTTELMKELQRRVNDERGTPAELTSITDILLEFSETTTMSTLLGRARKELDEEAASGSGRFSRVIGSISREDEKNSFKKRFPITANTLNKIGDTLINTYTLALDTLRDMQRESNTYVLNMADREPTNRRKLLEEAQMTILRTAEDIDNRLNQLSDQRMKALQKGGLLKFKDGQVLRDSSKEETVPLQVLQTHTHPDEDGPYGYTVYDIKTAQKRLITNLDAEFDNLVAIEPYEKDPDYEYARAVRGMEDNPLLAQNALMKMYREKQLQEARDAGKALYDREIREELDIAAEEANIVKGRYYKLPTVEEPVRFEGAYADFKDDGVVSGLRFRDRTNPNKTYDISLNTVAGDLSTEDRSRLNAIGDTQLGPRPVGRFSRTLGISDTVGTRNIKAAIDAVMSKLAPEIRRNLNVIVTKNQGTLSMENPGAYRAANMSRIKDLSAAKSAKATEYQTMSAELSFWFDNMPESVKSDPSMVRASFVLFDDLRSNEGKYLINPSASDVYSLFIRRSKAAGSGAVKLLKTEQGNVIAYYSGDLGEHASAAAEFGLQEGEFIRGTARSGDMDTWFDPGKATTRPLGKPWKRLSAKDLVEANQYARQQWEAFTVNRSYFFSVTRKNKILFDIMLAQTNAGVTSDFDTTPAAGFYYKSRDGKGNIILFTDNLQSFDEAVRVFAEEAVGHHGLSGFLGNDLEPVMASIYENNTNIRVAADAYAASVKQQTGETIGIVEAVEEVLADIVAKQIALENGATIGFADPLHIEVGLFTKLINEIKKLLNRLFNRGQIFDDEDVRQLLGDVRKYTATNRREASFNTRFNLRRANDPFSTEQDGRFSRLPIMGGEPKGAPKLTFEEASALGNTTKASAYELSLSGASNPAIANALGLKNANTAKQLVSQARTKLRQAGLTPRGPNRHFVPTKQEEALLAVSTRKPNGDYPTVDEASAATGLARPTIYSAMNQARQWYVERGMVIPEWLIPRRKGRYSRVGVANYAQAASPLYNPNRPIPRDLANALDTLQEFGTDMGQRGRDILNALKTMNFASRSNAGYQEGYRILTEMKNTISQLRVKYNDLLEDTLTNTDQKVRREVSKMLQFTAQAKLAGLSDKKLRDLPTLFRVEGNAIIIDEKAFAQISRMGRFTIDEFRKGVTRTAEVPYVAKDDTIQLKTETYTLDPMPGLTEDSLTWQLYQQVRDTMDEAALDRARADYAAAFGVRDNVFSTVEDLSNKILTDEDKKLIDAVDMQYRTLVREGAEFDKTGKLIQKVESMQKAAEFMADFNRVLIARTEDKGFIKKFADYFPADKQAEVSAAIANLRKGMTFTESNKFEVQRVITDLAGIQLGKEDSELYAKRSIAGGYIPIGRTGRWQTRIRAVDPKTGQVYGIMESFRSQLPYFQHENRGAAEKLANDINALFPEGKATVKIPVFDTKTKDYVVKEVRLEAVADAARETPSVDPAVNINEFMRMITRFGVTLTPQERERIIVGMTEQNARARTNLERQNTPGQDPDSVPYIAQHLETLANITGRRTHQHRTDILMDENNNKSQRLWNGDKEQFNLLKKRLDDIRKNPSATAAGIEVAEREFNEYAFMMRRTQEEGGAGTFKDRFVRDLAFLEEQKALEYTDFASDGVGQSIRTWTAVAQLGGSIATGALNLLSLPMTVIPALASYNAKNGFGGNFGIEAASVAVITAIRDVGGLGKYRARYYQNLLRDKDRLAKSGLTKDEAEFLGREIEFGNLQAALANALTASAKGRFGRSPAVQKFIDAYMSAFTYTEQAARRAAALAAYRLERDRNLEAGLNPKVANQRAELFAIDITNNALGNYSMYNRPGAFRGGLRDFIFMYKMHPISMVQLLSALDMKGRATMLLTLWLFSGFKGMPFAEDYFDLLDTIMQALWFKSGSSEAWLASQLNEIAGPGLTPVLMRGVVDQMVPGTISSRTGLGNMVPGTSMFVAGSNQFREVMDFIGPTASFVEGTFSTAVASTQLGLATVGLSDRSSDIASIMRGSPVTMMRAAGDMLEYYETGAITDSKGYVASYDVGPATYAFRALGFYPGEATRQNDVIRVTKRQADYLREISTGFRRSYVKAALRNDREGMQRVVNKVRDWNEAARGTGLEIPNFAINARRAVQEARKESAERYISSAPRSLRAGAQEAQEAFGAE